MISTHAPLAGCDAQRCLWWVRRKISTHAPLAGCDYPHRRGHHRAAYFNPRTPRGVRPAAPAGRWWRRGFQPTHPSRGATLGLALILLSAIISTHAPLAGCDPSCRCSSASRCDFNPRTPRGVRPVFDPCDKRDILFQPTHPSRGATLSPCTRFSWKDISTHAPLAGCDSKHARIPVGNPYRMRKKERDLRLNQGVSTRRRPKRGRFGAFSRCERPAFF